MASQIAALERYGREWKINTPGIPQKHLDLTIELECIKRGGFWEENGQQCGAGTFEHLMRARELIWPKRYRHRWTEQMYQEFVQNDLTILMGSASSQKTSHAVEFCLLNYWARPQNTLVILSTVNMDKLDIGIYAELQMLWKSGKDSFFFLSGNLIPYKRAITTDNLEDDGLRDFRRGCICRPCYVGGKFVGLGILAGVKQEHIFYVADELQLMQESFSLSWPHLFSNGHVKIIGSGNPKHDPDDELGKTAEPKCGWSAYPEPEHTEIWETKFMGARCINLVGTDSPNFDVPEGEKEPYPKLIGRKFSKRIAHDFGPDSFEFYRLVKGVMRVQFALARVITRQLCKDHGAYDRAEWKSTNQKKIYWLDPSYGGEDACVGGCLEWGEGLDGNTIIRLAGSRQYQFNLRSGKEVEDQIADILADELVTYNVPSTDVFYDSTGKGTLGGAFARKFREKAPVPVDSGGSPTKRPVREGLYVHDDVKHEKRLKLCNEHYSKFISELWFSVRYVIEANQMRELTEDFVTEGCARIYEIVGGNKIEVESKHDPKKKEDLKRRLGHSPNKFDGLAIGIEGARRRGFVIAKLSATTQPSERGEDWMAKESAEYEKLIKEPMLEHA